MTDQDDNIDPLNQNRNFEATQSMVEQDSVQGDFEKENFQNIDSDYEESKQEAEKHEEKQEQPEQQSSEQHNSVEEQQPQQEQQGEQQQEQQQEHYTLNQIQHQEFTGEVESKKTLNFDSQQNNKVNLNQEIQKKNVLAFQTQNSPDIQYQEEIKQNAFAEDQPKSVRIIDFMSQSVEIIGKEELIQKQQKQQAQFRENQVEMYNTIISRKEQCYEMLREWDTKRLRFLGTHGRILQRIIQEVDTRLQLSNGYLQLLMNFMDGKAKQETAFCNAKIPRISAEINTNDIMTKLFAEHNNILYKFQQSNDEVILKHQFFANYIWEEILNKKLVAHNKIFKSSLEEIYHMISGLKRQMLASAKKTQVKSLKLQRMYEVQSQPYDSQKLSQKKDLFKTLLSFLRHAELHKEAQKNLAKHTIRLYNKARVLEEEREIFMQQAINLYQEAYGQCYPQQREKFLDQLEIPNFKQNISDIYDVEEILGEQLACAIKDQLISILSAQLQDQGKELSKQKKDEIINKVNYSDVQTFLETFSLVLFEERILVLKQMQIERMNNADNQVIRTRLFISVDGYVHCRDIKQDLFDDDVQAVGEEQNQQDEDEKQRLNLLSRHTKSTIAFKLDKPIVKDLNKLSIELRNKGNFFNNLIQSGEKLVFYFNCEEEVEEFKRLVALF